MFLHFASDEFYQWDTGQVAQILATAPDVTEVHMRNNRIGGPAMVQPVIEGENGRYVEIPDVLFVRAGRIIFWAVMSGTDGCATDDEYDGIDVLARAKPTDYAPCEVETLYYKKLLERIDEMLKASKGEDGKSAYAYALEGGFVGTEEEFAEKMAEVVAMADQINGALEAVIDGVY